MRLRTKEITLFNERLILSERIVSDVRSLSTAMQTVDEDRTDIKTISFCINALQDALKINFLGLTRWQFYKRAKLKIMFRTKVLVYILGSKGIISLYNDLVEDLEAIETPKQGEGENKMSETYQYVLVANISNISLDEVDELPITLFREILELTFDWGNFLKGKDFNFVSQVEKRFELIEEHKKFFPQFWSSN